MNQQPYSNSVTTSDLREFVDILQYWSEKLVRYKGESCKALMYDKAHIDRIVDALRNKGQSVTLTVDEAKNLSYEIVE
ncbi:hypothetical protein [Vaginisenegalia massiliensis]|uniref:hypothetical protein n=1 Tax=Vaginisenegalia massiliensis TaxID=2058294 RepID=UPI000F5231DF|nr:hypothetical protein [Vaginisenegalia massiliensis]